MLPTGLLKHSIDGIFEIVRVVGRHLVSIAEVHAIVARAHLAQSEPEMARDRFGFLKRHGASMLSRYRSMAIRLFEQDSTCVEQDSSCVERDGLRASTGSHADGSNSQSGQLLGPRRRASTTRHLPSSWRADRLVKRGWSGSFCLRLSVLQDRPVRAQRQASVWEAFQRSVTQNTLLSRFAPRV